MACLQETTPEDGEPFEPVLPARTMPIRIGKEYRCGWMTNTGRKKFGDVWKMMREARRKRQIPTVGEAKKLIANVDAVDIPRIAKPSTDFQVTWLGHACFLIQVSGRNILTDPVFSDRCSMVQFAGPKRYFPIPMDVAKDLPPIDVVTVSHNHYDHLDAGSIKMLIEKHNPIFVGPEGMEKWFKNAGVPGGCAFGLNWWESVSFLGESVRVCAVPAQHWSMRSGFDRNDQLWCGFVITTSCGRKIFHAGDTGYNGKIFKEVGEEFGSIDLGLIPIGAYEPRWFMADQHVDPQEAVWIHKDINAVKSIGMHWGTFPLTLEPVDEPPKLLTCALEKEGLPHDCFIAMAHGATLDLNPKLQAKEVVPSSTS